MATTPYEISIFVNCPFDGDYEPILDALIFAAFDCGFVPRCAMEIMDSSQIRLDKIFDIISESKYAVHDISRTELDPDNQLPRFNMPLELGMFLGAKKYGIGRHKEKMCLIMDREKYRYQRYISDISGQDIRAHRADPETAIRVLRDWLRSMSEGKTIPGGKRIWERYRAYREALPRMCNDLHVRPDELTFNDKAQFSSIWLRQNG